MPKLLPDSEYPRPWKTYKHKNGWRISDAKRHPVAWFGERAIAEHITESVNRLDLLIKLGKLKEAIEEKQ